MTTFGTPAILLMYGATALERMNRLTAPDWIVWLGDRSYSVYLWHLPVVYALAGALKRAHPHGTVWHAVAVAVIVVAIRFGEFCRLSLHRTAAAAFFQKRLVECRPGAERRCVF